MKFIKRHLNEASLFPNVQKIKSAGGLPKAPAGSALASSATKAINGQVSKVLAGIIENLGINVVPVSTIFAMGDPSNSGAFHPKPQVLTPICNIVTNPDGTKDINITFRYGVFYKNTARNKAAEKMCISLDKIVSVSNKKDKVFNKFIQKVIDEIDKIYRTLPASQKYIYDYIKDCNLVIDKIQMFVGCSYMKLELMTGSFHDGAYDPRTSNGMQQIQDGLDKLADLFDFQCDVDFIVTFMGNTQDRNKMGYFNPGPTPLYIDPISSAIFKSYPTLKSLETAAGTPNLIMPLTMDIVSVCGYTSGKFKRLDMHYEEVHLFKYANNKFNYAGKLGAVPTVFRCISSDGNVYIDLTFKKNSVTVGTTFQSKRQWDTYDIKKSKKPEWLELEKFKAYLQSIIP